MFLSIFFLAYPITISLFGREWEPSVPVTRWLSILGVSGTFFILSKTGLLTIGKPEWTLASSMIDTAASIVGMLVGAQFGIVGVAMGRAIASTVAMPIPFVKFLNDLGIKFRKFFRIIRPSIIAGVITILGTLPGLLFVPRDLYYYQLAASFIGGSTIWLIYTYLYNRSIIFELVDILRKGLKSI
jgi:PST family polysaccharide transporter